MSTHIHTSTFSRRQTLIMGGALVGGLAAAPSGLAQAASPGGLRTSASLQFLQTPNEPTSMPVEQMQSILQAEGTVMNGVLSVEIDRTDMAGVTLHGFPVLPSFELNGTLAFQQLDTGQVFFNGDIALRPIEINPVIDAILANGLVFQAEHQHMYDFEPMVWFIHLRGRGEALTLATAAHKVLQATATPLPQKPPASPTTPFDQDRLKVILHGYDAEIGEDGVVTVYVARRDQIVIDGVQVKPQTNIATNIGFQPLAQDGSAAAVMPDFAMTAPEINPLIQVMRASHWDIGCLYNQETDEHPQLYFSHTFKTGNPYELAQEIRKGLDQTNSV